MANGRIQSVKQGGVGYMIFDHPERRNAMSRDMVLQAPGVLADFEADPDIRVVVVTGSGDKAFISGADISEFEKTRANAEMAKESGKASDAMFEGIRNFPKPTVAKIKGYCFGGGVAVACACDLRIAADDAQFRIPAARLGVAYKPSFTRWVADAVGLANAKEILITARRYNAAEALRMGLLHHVMPVAEFDAFADEYIGTIAENAPLSMHAAKVTANAISQGIGPEDAKRLQRIADGCVDSADAVEGRKAFMEKRTPAFTGR